MKRKLRWQNGRIDERINMKKERKFTEGGFEDIYPEVVNQILTNENPDSIAIAAGLSERQWECIAHYLDNPDFNQIAQELRVSRANIYPHLSQGFAKLEKWRKLIKQTVADKI